MRKSLALVFSGPLLVISIVTLSLITSTLALPPANAAPNPIEIISVAELSCTSVEILFKSSVPKKLLAYYVITATADPSLGQAKSIKKIIKTKATGLITAEIKSLNPSVAYKFSISAITNKAKSINSEAVEYFSSICNLMDMFSHLPADLGNPKPTPTPTPTPTAIVYTIGQTGPGGGKVFYVATTPFSCGPTLATTCTYLEAAPTSGTSAWLDAAYDWSGNTSDLIGANAQGTAIGTGYKNTLAIIGQNSTAGCAGTISQAYRGPNNLTDWYLPSKDELNELNIQKTTVGGFVDFTYWSSSEYDAGSAWGQYLPYGSQGFLSTAINTLYVRPVRAF